jgi:glucosamine-6-phosphate deaminase
MEVIIRQREQEGGVTVADIVDRAVRSGATTLGLATGSSPLSVYQELIRRHREENLTFRQAQAFLLDEYVGLPPSHPQSYARVIRVEFTDHIDIDPSRVHGPDGVADDIFSAAAQYDALITESGRVDVQLLGIGANGHIGFNEPGSSLGSRTRVATLTEQTRRDNARFFESIDEVPRHVITQGLGTIGAARHLVLIATGVTRRPPWQRLSRDRLPQAVRPRCFNFIPMSRWSSTRQRHLGSTTPTSTGTP